MHSDMGVFEDEEAGNSGKSASPRAAAAAYSGEHDKSCFKTDRAQKKKQSTLISPVLARLYAESCFLTEEEVHKVATLVEALDIDRVPGQPASLDSDEIMGLPEFVYNPFAHRILRCFDFKGNQRLSLEEIIEMFSVFSPRATARAKAHASFIIFDFELNRIDKQIKSRYEVDTPVLHYMLELF